MEKVLIKKRQSIGYSLKRNIKASRFLIAMIIPAILYYAIFCYIPMYGVLIAFTKFSPSAGIFGSIANNWIGWDNFRAIFKYPGFWDAFRNTILIGSLKVVISFLSAVTVAILINEIRMRIFKKGVQIIVTFPHFLSWVVVSSLFLMILDDNGAINLFITSKGMSGLHFYSNGDLFRVLLFSSDVWKEAGWSSIIYIATMAGISTDLYEAADIDGATRLQKIWHITLPGIKPVAILLLIMSVGGVLSAGFDQIYNMSSHLGNALVMDSVQIIDSLVYLFQFPPGGGNPMPQGQSTAIGLFKSVIGFVLVITTDRIAKLCGERGII